MTLIKLAALATFTALPALVAFTDTGAVSIPQHAELSSEERNMRIGAIDDGDAATRLAGFGKPESENRRSGQPAPEPGSQSADLGTGDRNMRLAELSTAERNGSLT